MSDYAKEFGKHVRSLRRARGVTQDALANRSGLSADTIRRIEHGSFSASIDTLRKLCAGLGVAPSTLFESFELGRTDERRELFDLISSRGSDELALVARVVRVLLDELDLLRSRMGPAR
ncbi:MAG TPA: helix-turn-helix transcriptional regulator [Enhygromyxa sp.]|nr:helix-turn-helix transcriptional regulator [Enhygromyxa sp.]